MKRIFLSIFQENVLKKFQMSVYTYFMYSLTIISSTQVNFDLFTNIPKTTPRDNLIMHMVQERNVWKISELALKVGM